MGQDHKDDSYNPLPDIINANVADLFGQEREEATEAQKREQERVIRMFRNVASTKDGMDLLFWIIEQGSVFATTFTGNSLGNFKEGERNLALKVLMNLLTVKPRAFADYVEARLTQEASDG